jgi:hypothetical protein
VGVEESMDAGVKACHFNALFNMQHGQIKYSIVGRRQFYSLLLTCL